MNLLTNADLEFERRFAAGDLPPGDFDHRAHLRLAYIHLATHGPDEAISTFREALLGFLRHHQIDPGKFHETITQAWLQAVWHFMQRAGDTTGSEDFMLRSSVLHDPKVMLTHYSANVLFGDEARRRFIAPDLDPIPRGATPSDHLTGDRQR
jgi:hypothetical protein